MPTQGFGLPDEEDGATRVFERDGQTQLPEADATRSWRQARRHAPGFSDDFIQEPTVTTNVTSEELEALRMSLRLHEARQDSVVPAAPLPASDSEHPELAAQEPVASHSRPRRRTVVKWLTSVAVLTVIGFGVVAHQTGYLSRFDMAQFDVSQVDVRPLQSALSTAETFLRTEYEKRFVKHENPPSPSLPLAAVPKLTAQDPIPSVEPLQDSALSEQDEEALLPPNDMSALIYEGGARAVEEPVLAQSETPSEEGEPQ